MAAAPSQDSITRNPPHASLLRLSTLSQLLAPGVIDPQGEDDMLMHLLHLAGVVENYNDAAWLHGVSDEKLQQHFNLLQGANWDYIEAHKWTMYLVDRLGPRPPILKDEEVALP